MLKGLNLFIGVLFSLTVNCQSYLVKHDNPNSNDWIIVWGGQPHDKYGYKFLSNQGYLDGYNTIYADYQISYEKCLKIVKSKNGRVCCVYGFSRGGYNAFNLIGKVEYVRLIDPLIPRKYDVDFSKSHVLMIYNPNVWDKANAKRLIEVSKKIESLKVNVPHLSTPRYFFDKYLQD
jgi:hypothetical protein